MRSNPIFAALPKPKVRASVPLALISRFEKIKLKSQIEIETNAFITFWRKTRKWKMIVLFFFAAKIEI